MWYKVSFLSIGIWRSSSSICYEDYIVLAPLLKINCIYIQIWGKGVYFRPTSLFIVHKPLSQSVLNLCKFSNFILFRIILATQLYAFPCKFENKMIKCKKPTEILMEDSIKSVDQIVNQHPNNIEFPNPCIYTTALHLFRLSFLSAMFYTFHYSYLDAIINCSTIIFNSEFFVATKIHSVLYWPFILCSW